MIKFTSPLFQKKALDALLESMADGLDGHDNYEELGAHRRGESTPEAKGTEFNNLEGTGFMPSAIVIPPQDLPNPGKDPNQMFLPFKDASPQFEMSASGIRRVGKSGHSPEWEKIQDILSQSGFAWMGHVSDGMEMWAKDSEQILYDPASRTWYHKADGKIDAQGALPELFEKMSSYKTARPTENKIELIRQRYKFDEATIEQIILTDPTEKDYVATIAAWVARKLIRLPEDTQKIYRYLR